MSDTKKYLCDQLAHAAGHKYIDRKRVNGKWVYTYPADESNVSKTRNLKDRAKSVNVQAAIRNNQIRNQVQSQQKQQGGLRGLISNIGNKLGVDEYKREREAEKSKGNAQAVVNSSAKKLQETKDDAYSDKIANMKEKTAIKEKENKLNTDKRNLEIETAAHEIAKEDLGKTAIGKLLNLKEKGSKTLDSGKKFIDKTVNNAKDSVNNWLNESDVTRHVVDAENELKELREYYDDAKAVSDKAKKEYQDSYKNGKSVQEQAKALKEYERASAVVGDVNKKIKDAESTLERLKEMESSTSRRGKIEQSIDSAEEWLKNLFGK